MKNTLEDAIFNSPSAVMVTDEDRSKKQEILEKFVAALPHNESGELDYDQVGKLFGDACFGVAGIEATDKARTVFKTCMVQALFNKVQDNLKQNPFAAIAAGAFKSQALAPAVAQFINGFIS